MSLQLSSVSLFFSSVFTFASLLIIMNVCYENDCLSLNISDLLPFPFIYESISVFFFILFFCFYLCFSLANGLSFLIFIPSSFFLFLCLSPSISPSVPLPLPPSRTYRLCVDGKVEDGRWLGLSRGAGKVHPVPRQVLAPHSRDDWGTVRQVLAGRDKRT